jgi:hypothetical protein
MNPSANSGHGHHQFLPRLATEAFNDLAADDPIAYQPLKLHYVLGFGRAGLTGEPVLVPTGEASIEDPSQTYGELEAIALCEYVTQNFCPPGGRTPVTATVVVNNTDAERSVTVGLVLPDGYNTDDGDQLVTLGAAEEVRSASRSTSPIPSSRDEPKTSRATRRGHTRPPQTRH